MREDSKVMTEDEYRELLLRSVKICQRQIEAAPSSAIPFGDYLVRTLGLRAFMRDDGIPPAMPSPLADDWEPKHATAVEYASAIKRSLRQNREHIRALEMQSEAHRHWLDVLREKELLHQLVALSDDMLRAAEVKVDAEEVSRLLNEAADSIVP